MVDMYVRLVDAGRRTCIPEHATKTCPVVPEKWREAVLADLLAMGMDGDGNPVE